MKAENQLKQALIGLNPHAELLALQGVFSSGKTSTLKRLINLYDDLVRQGKARNLHAAPSLYSPPDDQATFEFDGFRISISTAGDDVETVADSLAYFKAQACHLGIFAIRLRDDFVQPCLHAMAAAGHSPTIQRKVKKRLSCVPAGRQTAVMNAAQRQAVRALVWHTSCILYRDERLLVEWGPLL